jgi:imidazolonepropionase-like amidohydrolase
MAFAAPLQGQYDTAPLPAAWALEGVTVVHADARAEPGMTLVVRGGLIETLRAGAPVPPDARRIEWSDGTLHVYPGFVDAHGGTSVELPTPSREGVQSWSPTRDVQFYTPHREAATYLATNGEGLGADRRRGVVASLVFPGRGILPGQPSLILHRVDARTAGELVVRPSVGLAAAWQGAQGAYPGTLMAQHAFLRQAFADAEHHAAHMASWSRTPRGMAMPTRDADHEVVYRAASGSLPVLFQANGVEDIRRVLALSDELGFRPVVVGGAEAGLVADELGRRGITVLLNAGMPDALEWDPAEANAGELSPVAFRERQRLEPVYRTPARLAEAGVTFAFTSGGASGTDLLKGVRRAIEFGLPEGVALGALTAVPAGFLEIPEAVRLAEGMAANFIVTDRPLFDDDAGIAWTFVNGLAEKGRDPRTPREEGETPPEGTATAIGREAFLGRWEGTISGGPQALPVTLILAEGPDGSLAGTSSSAMGGETTLQDIAIDADRIQFGMPVPQGQGTVVRMEGIVDGDRMTGSGTFHFGDTSIPFTFEFRRAPGGALR